MLEYAFTALAKIIGIEFTALLAAIAAVFGTVKAIQAGGIVAKSSAANLLMLSSGLTSGAQGALEDEFRALRHEKEASDLLRDESTKLLEQAQDLLDTGLDLLEPDLFIDNAPIMILGETATNYYNRTVHSSNPGAQSLNIIENFVDISLTLPTMHQTMGGAL